MKDVDDQIRSARLSYRVDGDLDKYWSVVVERFTFLFQAIGYGLGHADWVEANANDHPELAACYRAKLRDLAGQPSGWMLDACRDAVQPFFHLEEWSDLRIYDPLIEVLERLLNQNGMYTRAHGDDIYVEMPYTGLHDLYAPATPSTKPAATKAGVGFWLSDLPQFTVPAKCCFHINCQHALV